MTAAATAASQQLWTSGGALVQRAQEPNIPFGNPSLRHIHNAHVTKEQKYHELTCDNMKRRLYYISTGTVAITCWHFGSMLEMGSD